VSSRSQENLGQLSLDLGHVGNADHQSYCLPPLTCREALNKPLTKLPFFLRDSHVASLSSIGQGKTGLVHVDEYRDLPVRDACGGPVAPDEKGRDLKKKNKGVSEEKKERRQVHFLGPYFEPRF
jgi:hypothetical protein